MNMDKALEIENKYRLTETGIDGFQYWNFFRFRVFLMIQTKKEWEGLPHYVSADSPVQKAKLCAKRLYTLLNPRFYKKKQSDFLFVSGGRKVLRNGLYTDPIADPVIRMWSGSLLFEYSTGGRHFRPTEAPNVYYSDRYGAVAEARGLFHRLLKTSIFRHLRRHITKTLSEPLQELCESYGVDIDWSALLDEMAAGYFVYHSLKKSYKRFLDRIHPKVLIVVCHYELQKMIFIELCKEQGIPTIELQHGTCGTDHLAYNYNNAVRIKQFPDYYLSFSEYWRHRARFPLSSDHVISAGFPYGEMRVAELQSRNHKGAQKEILFLSQATLGKSFSEIACRLRNLLDPDEYHIVFKMHPSEYNGWKDRYKMLAASSIEVADPVSSDLYELFARASFIVGMGSTTALYEGMMFDVPVFIYLKAATKEFLEMCKQGLAGGFMETEELYTLISENRQPVGKETFWQTDAAKTMRLVIEQIVYSNDGLSGTEMEKRC